MEDKVNYIELTSKHRMNLAAIKKVDPYANDILDSSAHVAFYTFNSAKNEWEKTDVEGAFFIYRRNAEPFYSIFVNNRLNTTSFVEPITCQLEMQSQPPFLLYRNDRSRIRGFWFYSSRECDRISYFISSLLHELDKVSNKMLRNCNSNIFSMLSKAQNDYTQNISKKKISSCNVLNFFAALKPTSSGVCKYGNIPNSVSVEQLEKQQVGTPMENFSRIQMKCNADTINLINRNSNMSISNLQNSSFDNLLKSVNFKLCNYNQQKVEPTNSQNSIDDNLSSIFKTFTAKVSENQPLAASTLKPSLMPPTMFETAQPHNNQDKNVISVSLEPLNCSQFVHAFRYLLKHDIHFIKKLHDAYLHSFSIE